MIMELLVSNAIEMKKHAAHVLEKCCESVSGRNAMRAANGLQSLAGELQDADSALQETLLRIIAANTVDSEGIEMIKQLKIVNYLVNLLDVNKTSQNLVLLSLWCLNLCCGM